VSSEANVTTTLEEEREQARALTRQIHEDVRNNPDSPYAGKFVGILRGQVVVVADTLDEVAETLEQLEPDQRRRFFTEASADYDKTVYIYAGGSGSCRG
jgi:hypothetical protein